MSEDGDDVFVSAEAVAALLAQAAKEADQAQSQSGDDADAAGDADDEQSFSRKQQQPRVSLSSSGHGSPGSHTAASASASAGFDGVERLLVWGKRRDEKRKAERARLAAQREAAEVEECTFQPVDLPSVSSFYRGLVTWVD